MSNKKRVGVALFGLGRIGKIHLKNLLNNKNVNLLWIVEQNERSVDAAVKTFGIEDVKIANIDETENVLKDSSVTAVVICTPTDTHAHLTMQALEAGKHVLCEKPISEDTQQIIRCFDVAAKSGKILMAAFNRLFDTSYRDIFNKVRSGQLGNIHMVRSTFRDTPLWLGADTLSQTFLCHDIEILCWIMDGLPESLVCFASANITMTSTSTLDMNGKLYNLAQLPAPTNVAHALNREPLYADDAALASHTLDGHKHFIDSFIKVSMEVAFAITITKTEEIAEKGDVDCIVVTMKFPNGAIGILDFSRYSCYGYDIRLEVFGSKGMVKLEPKLQTDVFEYIKNGKKDPPCAVSFPDRFENAYIAELDHFVQAILGNVAMEVSRDQSERVGFVLDAIKESYKTSSIVHLKK